MSRASWLLPPKSPTMSPTTKGMQVPEHAWMPPLAKLGCFFECGWILTHDSILYTVNGAATTGRLELRLKPSQGATAQHVCGSHSL